ncbi:MAG TPA: LamG domain-containing protein [Candidatus Acidoferrales bacterium]|jgi:hypothetical protein|nr:LamG domain-containing protein [Candidatus Acidoferrales bacterium]
MDTASASQKHSLLIFTACLFLVAFALPAGARTSSVRYFRLGEADNTVAGDTAATSVDSSRYPGRSDLMVIGSPVYSADVANANSTLSLQFDGSEYAYAENPYILTTNFGVEAWVKPAATGSSDRYIVYSGAPANSGWGIVQRGSTGKFQALFGGRTYVGAGDIIVGQWTHLAFVCTATNAVFYVNGVPSGDPVAQLPSGTFVSRITIGDGDADPQSRFQGNIDEVRIFAFADGEFVPTDLRFTVRPPALAMQRQAGQSTLSWPEVLPDYGVETATDLTGTNGWTPVYGTTFAYDRFSITNTDDDDARFYRLSPLSDFNLPPALPAGQFIVLNDIDNEFSKDITNPGDKAGNTILGDDENALDASSFVDLSIPHGMADDLNFHWVITFPGAQGIFADQGITGYYSPVLHMAPAALVTAETLASAPTFTLTVTSKNHPSLATTVQISAEVAASGLTLISYDNCQGQTHACPGCTCTVTNALPTLGAH